MKVQIDQSIKIEDTSRDTIIAFSNDIVSTVLIPRKVKRQLQEAFRENNKPHLFVYRTFAAGIVLLIKNYLREIDTLIIDQEYIGREKLIEDMVLEMLKRLRRKQPQIYFRKIGRKSNAHNISYLTMKRKIRPNAVLKLKEFKALSFN